ncbi:MAG: YncE family protein, partial [Verrucomicrobiota bacterium]|nr:YncE family protein [Verrucomicrobiota bacterium]
VANNGGPPGITTQLTGIATGSPSVGATIAVGLTPVAVAITPNGNYAYVVNYGTGTGNSTVSVIQNASTSSPSIVATVTVGNDPSSVSITPNGNWAYVGNLGDHTISVIQNASTSTPSVATTITSLPGPTNSATPFGIAFTQNSDTAYVTDQTNNWVIVLQNTSPSSPSVLTTVNVGTTPSNSGCMGLAAPHQVLVLDSTGSDLYTIDETSLSATPVSLNLGSSVQPQNVVLTNDRMHAYISENASNPGLISYIAMDYESLYPPLTAGTSVSVGPQPEAMILSPDGNYIYVADIGQSSPTVIPPRVYRVQVSNNSVTELVSNLGGTPGNIGIDPTGAYLVVTLPSKNEIMIVSSPSGTPSTSTVAVGTTPMPSHSITAATVM